MDRPRHVYQTYIRTTPEALWRALTDPQMTRQYWFGALSRSDWGKGSRWTSESEDGELYLEGEILEIDPGHRLVHSFHVVHDPDAAAEPPSRVTFEIEVLGEVCRLTVTHEDLEAATERYVTGGWETIGAGLKTLLETGQPLRIGEPAGAGS